MAEPTRDDPLREDLGATYGVSVSGSISRRPDEEYSFTVSFGTAPQEVEGLIDTVFEELEDVKANGIDPENLAKVEETHCPSCGARLRSTGDRAAR